MEPSLFVCFCADCFLLFLLEQDEQKYNVLNRKIAITFCLGVSAKSILNNEPKSPHDRKVKAHRDPIRERYGSCPVSSATEALIKLGVLVSRNPEEARDCGTDFCCDVGMALRCDS
ncbi:hypothetical protein AAFF_G00388060 [Aldrovandia affinis]|uniref:Uncharacterized protein n=1 Tax=Aldrovandia affinis TaxID=143900 RepID=A0AAD7SEY5_9TELE|nr:hypothetical protein AAFF_G00388060 [Aldrovandia affinis]